MHYAISEMSRKYIVLMLMIVTITSIASIQGAASKSLFPSYKLFF